MMTMFSRLAKLATALCPILLCAGAREQLSADALRAFAQGANIEIDLRVVDSTGKPVEGASVNVGLSQKQSDDFKSYAGRTDTNGNWRVEARCSNLIHVRVTKEGHYETRIDRHLFSVDYADVNRRVKGRRWSPWEQIVVLKEKRRPIPMFCGTKERGFSIPRNATVGFDFEKGELVKPHGSGEHPDIMLVFSSNAPMKFSPARTNGLEISTANSDEGFIKKSFDAQSAFKSIYECPEADYVRKMSFSFAYSYTKVDNQRFPAGEYLVFRTRARHDEHGNLVGSRYGKIYSLSFDDDPDTPGNGFISLSYRFNPNENDRNLEWDGEDLSSGRKYDIDKILAPL